MRNLILLVLAVIAVIALMGWGALKLFGLAASIITVVVMVAIVGGFVWLLSRDLDFG